MIARFDLAIDGPDIPVALYGIKWIKLSVLIYHIMHAKPEYQTALESFKVMPAPPTKTKLLYNSRILIDIHGRYMQIHITLW